MMMEGLEDPDQELVLVLLILYGLMVSLLVWMVNRLVDILMDDSQIYKQDLDHQAELSKKTRNKSHEPKNNPERRREETSGKAIQREIRSPWTARSLCTFVLLCLLHTVIVLHT